MPSHKIHISIAQEINKKLKLDNDEISLGSVLPDLSLAHNHGIPHFQVGDSYPDSLANPYEFIKECNNKLNTIDMGYLIHLLTDRFYNQKYLEKFFIFKDGKPFKLIFDIDDKDRKCIKKHDFHEYDKYLIDLGKIKPFNNLDVLSQVKSYGNNIDFDLNSLKEYMDNFNKHLEEKYLNYNFLCWKKEELDKIYDECIEYILSYLKEKGLGGSKHV